jgi:glycosyltransferase involved in cell wall biosynthesis
MAVLREKGYDLSLTVVGKVADQKIYETIKEDPYTQCLPAQPKEALINLYRKHDIFVMPSFTESFGLVYAEAMSQGLPVIYSKEQGFDHQFPEGTVGYHVSPYDPQEVAEGIEKVISRYAQIAPQTSPCAKQFNWSEITHIYHRIYHKII